MGEWEKGRMGELGNPPWGKRPTERNAGSAPAAARLSDVIGQDIENPRTVAVYL